MDRIGLYVWNFLSGANEEHLKKLIDEFVRKFYEHLESFHSVPFYLPLPHCGLKCDILIFINIVFCNLIVHC